MTAFVPGPKTLPPYSPGEPNFFPQPRFDVLVVDPPWSYGKATAERTTSRNVSSRHYATMGQEGGGEINRRTGAGILSIIEATPIPEWAAPNAHLYLWTTNPKLPFAFAIMEQWGFVYKTTLTWVKTKKDGGVHGGGMGWFFRGATEHVLFGVRGNKPIPSALRAPNVVMAQKGRHSEKPDAFYALVDAVSGTTDRKLDVYCRGVPREGWWGWGNEVSRE